MFRAFLFLVLCAEVLASSDPIATFADLKKPLREIFISPTGNNQSGDGSRNAPFQTVNRAIQGLRAGDAIRLLPGDYTGGVYIPNIPGTAEAPIWFGGEPGQPKPLFKGGQAGIHISGPRYLIVENLEISGASGNGINCDDGGQFANPEAARHIVFRNIDFRDIGSGKNQDGLKLSGLNDFFVLNCSFTRISINGSGIDHVGCHRGVVGNCVFTEGGNSVQCKGGSEDIEIRGNRFMNVAGRGVNIGGSTGFSLFRPPLSANAPNWEARNIRVFANLFVGTEAPACFVNATDCIAANNTIVNPTRFIVRILQETLSKDGFTFPPCGNNQFVNNLIDYEAGRVGLPVNVGPNTDAATFVFANNLWFARDRPQRSRPALPSAETGSIYGMDPMLKNPGASDFSLKPASPAAGKGRKLPAPKTDFANQPYADNPSIGAFEK